MPMFERMQKPFLTVETGEAYQPIRLVYQLNEKDDLVKSLEQLRCIEKKTHENSWNWYWKEECDDLHFESLDSYQKRPDYPLRLGTLSLRDGALHINLPSFKRACLAVPFFYKAIQPKIAHIEKADFVNKVFGLSERLPHGFAELFKEEELEHILHDRLAEYEKVQKRCEDAATPEEAMKVLADYTENESHKKLPFAERYSFESEESLDPDIIFLSFYIFLRSRELVAIRRWYGATGFTLSDAVDEAVDQVFGGMDIDIIE